MNRAGAIVKILIISAVFVTATAESVLAGVGSGGGGELVRRHHAPVLRDVVDPSTCTPYSGQEVYDQNPTIQKILNKLGKLDWYFAFDIKRQLLGLNFCYTSGLLKVNTADNPADRVTAPDSAGPTEQGAIRSDDDVFVETKKVAEMSPVGRALLMIHETMHSYLPMDTVRRNFNLRNMVRTISDIYHGKITTRKKLQLAMTMYKIDFPQSVDRLDSEKDFIMLVISDYATARDILMKSDNLETLLASPIPNAGDLAADDQQAFESVAADRYGEIMEPICEAKDVELISNLQDEVKLFDPAMICLGASAVQSDSDFIKLLVGKARLTESIQKIYGEYAKVQTSFSNARIMISSLAANLSASQIDARSVRPVTALDAITPSTSQMLGAEPKSLASGLAFIAKAGRVDIVIAQTGQSADFYSAFSVTTMLAQIAAMPEATDKEKALAAEILPEVYRNYIQFVLDRISAAAGADVEKQVEQSIDFSKLGYTLNK